MINLLFIFVISFVALYAAFTDYKKYGKSHRFILLIISGMLLLGFMIQPEGWRDDDTSSHYALLTDGTDFENLNTSRYDSLFSIEPFESKLQNGVRVQSAELLSMFLSEGSEVDVYGYGVDEKLPENYLWNHQMTSPNGGILLNSAPLEVETGSDFEISVSVQPAAENDSLQIYKDNRLWRNEVVGQGGSGTITFTDKLDLPGPASYRFEWVFEDSVISETWNIRAVNPERLKISVLLYSPSFEVNYLASHFAERGHSLQQRIRIGDDRFRFDAVNAQIPDRNTILDNLQQADLLILDVREFGELDSSQQSQIKDAIEGGLDVLVIPPVENQTENWQDVFSDLAGDELGIESINRLEERSWTPSHVESTPAEIVRTTLLDLNFIELPENSMVLERGVGDIPAAVRVQNGSGSVSGHLFYQTYRWLLAGYSDAYNHFWSDYLSRVVTLEESLIDYFPMVPLVDKKMVLTSTAYDLTNMMKIRSMQNTDTLSVPVKAAFDHPNSGTASFWPENSGWHLANYSDKNFWFYVYNDGWKFDREYRKYVNTKNQVEQQNKRENERADLAKNPIPDLLWLISFLLIQCWLWIERKWGMT
ncbi:MAG: hypothetical protein WEA58_01910 [Balneolaceae bacterium]